MSALAQTALDFCRECMGWEEASHVNLASAVIWNGQIREHSSGLHFTDLNAVMDAVRKWCDMSGLTLVVTSQDATKMFRWRVQVSTHGYTLDNDLCHALLAACVEASRKTNRRPDHP